MNMRQFLAVSTPKQNPLKHLALISRVATCFPDVRIKLE